MANQFDIGVPVGGQHPVKRFRGTLRELNRKNVHYDAREGQKARDVTYAEFKFADCEILEVREGLVYTLPTVTFEIQYVDPNQRNASENSRWEAMASSIRKTSDDLKPNDLLNKTQEWAQLDWPLRAQDDDGKWITRPTPAWQLVSIEGASNNRAADVIQYIIETAEGKTETELYTELMANTSKLNGQQQTIDKITSGTLVEDLVSTNILSKAKDGTLSKGTNAP